MQCSSANGGDPAARTTVDAATFMIFRSRIHRPRQNAPVWWSRAVARENGARRLPSSSPEITQVKSPVIGSRC